MRFRGIFRSPFCAALLLWLSAQVASGDVPALLMLPACGTTGGIACLSGTLPEIDRERIFARIGDDAELRDRFTWCLAGNDPACVLLSFAFDPGDDPATPSPEATMALSLLGPPCDRGIALACSTVALYYATGNGVPQDPELSATLLKATCEGGLVSSCTVLGNLYLHAAEVGLAAAPMTDDALKLYTHACRHDDADGCQQLGQIYLEGSLLPQDIPFAEEMFDLACRNGLAIGCESAGSLFRLGRYREPDPLRAFGYYNEACGLASPFGCHNAAGPLYDGLGRDRQEELSMARQGFEAACDGGVAQGCDLLGRMLTDGLGGPADPARGASLVRRACEAGSAVACSNLAPKYEYGSEAIPQDANTAAKYYDLACAGRNGGGCNGLGNMYAKGEGIAQNDRRAVDLYRLACDLGEAIGCANVALFGERMRGTLRVWSEIRQYYGLVCERGFDPACQRLNEIGMQP